MIERRPFNQLGRADHGWLKARHPTPNELQGSCMDEARNGEYLPLRLHEAFTLPNQRKTTMETRGISYVDMTVSNQGSIASLTASKHD